MNSTTKQNITPELRQWIVDQAKAGRSPDDVLKSMIDSGWTGTVVHLAKALSGVIWPVVGERM